MQVTVELAEDVFTAASKIAEQEDCSLESAVIKLARQGIEAPRRGEKLPNSALPSFPGKFPFTSEDVYRMDTP